MNSEMITIIVPVYNVEKYIGKCLDSLMKQTYANIEIVCVDEKGTENAFPKICSLCGFGRLGNAGLSGDLISTYDRVSGGYCAGLLCENDHRSGRK